MFRTYIGDLDAGDRRLVATPDRRKRLHLNADQRRALKVAAISTFCRKYARKAQPGVEPNDRSFDRHVRRFIDRMRPDAFDDLLHDDEA